MADRRDVDRWIGTAIKNKAKYIISMCDTFDYDDYPVYCMDIVELKSEHTKRDGINMQRVNEIIRINPDGSIDENLSIFNID